MDHAITTTFAKIEVAKVNLTTSKQRIWPYQHIKQFVQLPPTGLSKPKKLTFIHVLGGFWAVIFSWAAWKRSWVGCNPAQSKTAMERSVATTSIVMQAQLLTA